MNAQKEIIKNTTINRMVIKELSQTEKLEEMANGDGCRIKLGDININLESTVPEFTKNYLKIVVRRGEDVKNITKKLRTLNIKYSISAEGKQISTY
ncbi:hypothetical protein I8748_09105 [Nostoc sp. CENA67]|uniref:Uncharacterized protein n=1 Tax=Amazonocrinis nigriterrae CENA67 TaxID=2794033 RepID=A0A8J7L7P1_9NOST|nr:hypothetical protein [Amazonocrinis nigriterrae]MBH8562330.1 hypothetical protein [Amazonocrinis nigriterrae CENA67]